MKNFHRRKPKTLHFGKKNVLKNIIMKVYNIKKRPIESKAVAVSIKRGQKYAQIDNIKKTCRKT